MHYDLIIVGGGLVGAGLAVALREVNLHIALIDARLPHNDDPRLFALNNSSCQFLKNIGLWHKLNEHASPIRQVHVSHSGHFGSARLRSEEVNLQTLGHVVPARYIESALNEELTSLTSCTIYRPAQLQFLHQQNNLVHIKILTEDGEKNLTSSLLIGADGTESTVRKQINIPVEIFDYKQSAIVTITQLKRSHHDIAYERFNTSGAIAMLPLVGNECATIWTVNHSLSAELMAFSDKEFIEKLQKQFGYRLGRLEAIGKRYTFPLRMVKAERNCKQNVFLLGNSEHTLSPIAAQGFNLALYKLALLVEEMKKNQDNKNLLNAENLQNFNEKSRKQQIISIGVSHRLSRMFLSKSIIMNNLIQLGMMGIDVCTPIKKRFINKMMGRIETIPRLLI